MGENIIVPLPDSVFSALKRSAMTLSAFSAIFVFKAFFKPPTTLASAAAP